MTVRELVSTLMSVDDEAWDCEVMMVAAPFKTVKACSGVLGDGDIPGGPGCEGVTGWYLLIEKPEDSVQEGDEDGM